MNYKNLTPEEIFRLVKVLWRILATIFIAQVMGMITGFMIKPYHMLFFDLWYGMAYATPAGYLLGLLWIRISQPGRISQEVVPLAILGIMCFTIPIFGYFFSFLVPEFKGIQIMR